MQPTSRRTFTAGALSLPFARGAWAAEWPQRSITLMHGFPPGGTVDLVARIVADELAGRLKQPVIVESKPGASGTVAASHVGRAAPDGYTLFAIPSGHVVVGATFKNVPYRTIDDFSPIGTTTEFPYVLVTPADAPKSLDEFIQFGKSRNTPLLYGTAGKGSGPHLAVERLAHSLGIHTQHVPYRGSSAALQDLLGGRLAFMLDPPGPLLENISGGKLNALAVTGEERFFSLPSVPTLQEQGVRGYVVTSWQALLAPAGLPEPIQTRLNSELNALLRSESVTARFRAMGTVPKPSTPAELKARMQADLDSWNALVAATGFERI